MPSTIQHRRRSVRVLRHQRPKRWKIELAHHLLLLIPVAVACSMIPCLLLFPNCHKVPGFHAGTNGWAD